MRTEPLSLDGDPQGFNVSEGPVAAPTGLARRIDAKLLEEFRQVIPPTIFFFVGFNLILFTKRLILADYLIQFGGFFVATTAALIVGKVVLVADKMPLLRRFDYAPLAYPVSSRQSSIPSSSLWRGSSRRSSII